MRLPDIKKIDGKNLLKGAAGYLIANGISGLIPFALLLILTRYLSPEDFGIVALYTALTAIASAIFSLGLNGAIGRYYFELSKQNFSIFVGSCLSIVGIAGLIFSILIFAFGDFIFSVIHFPVKWIWAVLLTGIAQVVMLIGLAIFQVRNQVFHFTLTQIAQAGITGILSIIFVTAISWGWEGRILAQVFSVVASSIAILYYLIKSRSIIFCLNRDYCYEALKYGLPLAIHAIGGIAVSLSDRFILARLTTLEDIGFYAVAGQIVTIFIFAVDAFNRAYSPWLFSVLSEGKPEAYNRIVKGTYVYFVSIFLLAIIFAKFSEWFLRFAFVGKYLDAIEFIFPLCLAAAFMGMYYMVTLYLQFAKRTKQLASITLIVGGINILLSIKLVEWYGAIGASYALIFAQFLMFFACWIASAYFFPMPWLSTLRKKPRSN